MASGVRTDESAGDVQGHLHNVAENLQLIADLGYCDAALAVVGENGVLTVVRDARPSTALDPVRVSRAGRELARDQELQAYDAVQEVRCVRGPWQGRDRTVAGIAEAWPVGAGSPYAVVLRTFGAPLETTPSHMEQAFVDSARGLVETLGAGPLLDVRTGEPFSTTRRAGDGVLRVSEAGRITYASPNAVGIMRLAGVEGRITARRAAELPGGGPGILPVLGARGAMAVELEVAGRILSYRAIALPSDALVLVEDLTEARRRERELEVKEATIREVHHRVKNNLQTIASLLRLQERRSRSAEVRRALSEATERAAAMAAVHDLLARSDREFVDFTEVARRVVELVASGAMGAESRIAVSVSGSIGDVGASMATSLALTLTELVHNALQHAFAERESGAVAVVLRRDRDELVLTVRDDGGGLPPGLDPARTTSLGFSIMRTLIEDDLRGSLEVVVEGGTSVTVRVPLGATST